MEKKRFFRARMTFSQLLIMRDRALKLYYTSVIYVNHEVQIDASCLNYFATVAACHIQVLW